MERIDCEKCIHSFFEENDKLRCSCKDCTPDYPDMREAREALIAAFPGSCVNENREFIRQRLYIIRRLKNILQQERLPCKRLMLLMQQLTRIQVWTLTQKLCSTNSWIWSVMRWIPVSMNYRQPKMLQFRPAQ